MSSDNRRSEEERFVQQLIRGIDKFREKTYDQTRMNQYARKYAGKFLNKLTMGIVEDLKKINGKKVNVLDLQKVVVAILPQYLAEHAASEGQKEIFLAQNFNEEMIAELSNSKAKADKKMLMLMQRKEQDILCRNIIRAIPEILARTLPKTKLDQQGNKCISYFMIQLADEMIRGLKEDNDEDISLAEVEDFVKDFFPSSLAKHAHAEGLRRLLGYDYKEFQFTPKTVVDTISEEILEEVKAAQALGVPLTAADIKDLKKKKATEGCEFQSGLIPLTRDIHADGKLPQNSQNLIDRTLNKIKNRIIRSMKAQQGKKTPDMAQDAIDGFFPPLLKEHANAEGHKMLQRYGTGEFDFNRDTSKEESDIRDLEPGVESIAASISKKIKLENSVRSSISKEMNLLVNLFIGRLKASDEPSDDLVDVTLDILPRPLAEHAIAEGEKMVALCDRMGLRLFH